MPTPETPALDSRRSGSHLRSYVPLLLAIAGGLLAGWILNGILDDAIAGRTDASALSMLARTGPEVEAALAAGQDPETTIDRLGRQLSLRATLVAPDGRVLGDSGVDHTRLGSLENHAGRPEVREALRLGHGVRTRFSSTLGERLVYAAVRLRGGQVLRLAFPEKELAEWEAPYRRRTLALSALAGLLVGGLLVRSRFRHAAELHLVRRAVADVERGEHPANPGAVSEGAASVFAALGDLADLSSGRDAETRRRAAIAQAVFNGVPVGLLVVDSQLSLLDANAEALRLVGAVAEDLRPGEHVLELVREKAFVDLLESAFSVGNSSSQLQLPPERGGRLLLGEALIVAGDGASRLPSVVAILRETRSPRSA